MAPERLTVEALVAPAQRHGDADRARRGCPTGATVTPDDEHDEFAWWPADLDALARARPTRRCGAWPTLLRRRCSSVDPPAAIARRSITFRRLEIVVVRALGGLPGAAGLRVRARQPAAGDVHASGWRTGCCWIAMSLVCIAAARARIIPFWLAVTVAVLGGLGPFAGTIGFVVEQRRSGRIAQRPASLRRTSKSDRQMAVETARSRS